VKVHFLDGHLVDFRFGLAQAAEHRQRILRGARRQAGLFDNLDDVREMPVSMLLLHRNVEFGGADSAALDFLEGDGGADFERGDGVGDGGLAGAGVGQRTHQHIAANSRKGVQVTGQGHVSSWWHKLRGLVGAGAAGGA
jgi:hypothetical protein